MAQSRSCFLNDALKQARRIRTGQHTPKGRTAVDQALAECVKRRAGLFQFYCTIVRKEKAMRPDPKNPRAAAFALRVEGAYFRL